MKINYLICYFFFSSFTIIAQSNLQFTIDCEDVTICLSENCLGQEQMLQMDAITDCSIGNFFIWSYSIDFFNDGFFEQSGNGNQIFDFFEIGEHRIVFTVTDQCGTSITCDNVLTTKDCYPPEILSYNPSVVSEFNNVNGTIEIHIDQFDISAIDNCTNENEILKSLLSGSLATSMIYDCHDYLVFKDSFDTRYIYITDSTGNQDSSEIYIHLEDDGGVCNFIFFDSIPICVKDKYGNNIPEVYVNSIELIENGDCHLHIPEEPFTIIKPRKSSNDIAYNGVNLYDVVLVEKHMLQIQQFNDSYLTMAGDLNGSGAITAHDIQMLKTSLRNGTFQNLSWRFVKEDHVFLNPNYIGAYPDKETVFHNNIFPIEFTGVKMGDVNNSMDTTFQTLGFEESIAGEVSLCVTEQSLTTGEEFTVAISALDFDSIVALKFTIEFNSEKIKIVYQNPIVQKEQLTGFSNDDYGIIFPDIETIPIVWVYTNTYGVNIADHTPLISMKFEALDDVKLSDAFEINSSSIEMDAYNNSERLELKFDFCGTVSTSNPLKENSLSVKNVPNPFSHSTNIIFQLSEYEEVTCNIYDVSGRKVLRLQEDFPSGENSFFIEGNKLLGNGIYFYEIIMSGNVAVGKMIVH